MLCFSKTLLTLHVFHPEGFKASDQRPAFVVIHGGGWTGGTPRRFYPYVHALVGEGYVGISVEYRLINAKAGTTVFDCVKADAPPTIIFHGDADKTTPCVAKLFTGRKHEAGNVCELITHPGGGHGHINNMALFDGAMAKTAAFLSEHLDGLRGDCLFGGESGGRTEGITNKPTGNIDDRPANGFRVEWHVIKPLWMIFRDVGSPRIPHEVSSGKFFGLRLMARGSIRPLR